MGVKHVQVTSGRIGLVEAGVAGEAYMPEPVGLVVGLPKWWNGGIDRVSMCGAEAESVAHRSYCASVLAFLVGVVATRPIPGTSTL